jgi:Rrf2 family transcriptional regulator, iron-responsive regulator
MLLTKKACYGLITVKYLAENAERETPFRAKDLAELYGIPEETLAKTLQHLVKAGILQSRQGINGGYRLARDPQHVTVLDVIKASEETSRSPVPDVPSGPMFDPLRTVRMAAETALGQLAIASM